MKSNEKAAQPAEGAINCILGQLNVSIRDNIESRGRALAKAEHELAIKTGLGLVALLTEKGGNGALEFQITRVTKETGGEIQMSWKVDVYRARSREWIIVPVRILREVPEPGAPVGDLSVLGTGRKLGTWDCRNCGKGHDVPPFTGGEARRVIACTRCNLPMRIQLKDVEALNG